MAEKERITNPSMGSNELGEETEERRGSGVSTGTDTQTQIAALSAQRKKEKDEANAKIKNTFGESPNEALKDGDFPVK